MKKKEANYDWTYKSPDYLKQKNKDVNLVKIITGIRWCFKSLLLDLFHQYLTQNCVSDEYNS